MKLLFIGGTQFLGRHLTERALAAKHELTLFHRGKTNPGLFAGAEEIHGDRATDLDRLAGRQFDCVVDLCGYFPRLVEMSARALRDCADHYTFISSVSVYRDIDRKLGPMDETSDVFELADPTIEVITNDSYGGLKALCESAAGDTFGRNRTMVVRPGLIVGPYDHTGRFTYWCDRVARGGVVAVPGTPERHHPVIDVRDLAAWILDMVVTGIPGRFNAAGPNTDGSPRGEEPTFGAMLGAIREAAGASADFRWIGAETLHAIGVAEEEFPLWILAPDGTEAGFDIDSSRAFRSGLTLRPLVETARDTLEWYRSLPAGSSAPRGPSPAREEEMLAAVRNLS